LRIHFSCFIVSLLFVFMITGCAQWGGDNPLGLTGGSNEGYGQNNDLNLPDSSSGNAIDPELVGLWSTSGEWIMVMFSFTAEGVFTRDTYYGGTLRDSMEGIYSVSENILTLRSDDITITYVYSITGNYLTLNDGKQELVLIRLDSPQIIWWHN
jgi:hypothetical protein